MDGGQSLLRQHTGQHMGHLRPGGGIGQAAVQLRAQHALCLEIPEIGKRRRTVAGIGCGPLLRVAGAVQAADASGEDDDLPHGHGVLETVSPVGLAHGQAVLIQGRHIVIEYGVGGQVGELAGIGLTTDKVFRAVGSRQGRHGQQQADGQQQGGSALVHECSFLKSPGTVIWREDAGPP